MNNEFCLVNDMQQNCKLYGIVEVDQLRSAWKARKYPIEVPVSLVQSGLLPSIFDWPLMGQLMPMDQAMGEAMLQQRINDLELLNSLTTSLQRIEIQPEAGIEVDVVLGRPSYNVQVQDNGSILVKELPSLHIHIHAVESRAAAGHECELDITANNNADNDNDNANDNENANENDNENDNENANENDNENDNENANEKSNDNDNDKEDNNVADEPNNTNANANDDDNSNVIALADEAAGEQSSKDNDRRLSEQNLDNEQKIMQLTKFKKDSQENFDFLQAYEDCDNLTDADEPNSDFLNESEEQTDMKLRRRMTFWMRFGHWLRQNVPRLN